MLRGSRNKRGLVLGALGRPGHCRRGRVRARLLRAVPDFFAVSANAKLSGLWTVAAGSVAGYRVREKLGFLPAEDDAVGRTSHITGTATPTEAGRVVRITAAPFTVAVSTLKSDQAMRDPHIRTIGLQSDLYPRATFKLTKPVVLRASALQGGIVRAAVARRVQHPRHFENRDSSGGVSALGCLAASSRLAQLPLEQVQHDRPERRRVRQREEQGGDRVRRAPHPHLRDRS